MGNFLKQDCRNCSNVARVRAVQYNLQQKLNHYSDQGDRFEIQGRRTELRGYRCMPPQLRPLETMVDDEYPLRSFNRTVHTQASLLFTAEKYMEYSLAARDYATGFAPPEFPPTECRLSAPKCVSSEELLDFILTSPPKFCELDPLFLSC